MAEVQWIKIVTNVFDNRKIKLIETMPEGDTIIVIWFKLLCMAGSTNDGGSVYFTKDIPFTDEMLSHVFGRPLQIIRLALKTFQQFNMIEVVDNFIQISSWEKYQNVEGLDKIREQTRLRVQKHRETKALDGSNVTVTLRNATEENREEKNRVDKESSMPAGKPTRRKFGEYGKVLLTEEQHERLISDFGQQVVDDIIRKMDEWITMKGKGYKDYNLAIRKWIKDEKSEAKSGKKKSEFTNYEQRTQSYDDIMKDLSV